MAALRSALAMLSRGSCQSSAAAYMGGRGRGLELNQVVRHVAPPALPVAPLLHPAVTRNFKGYRHFSAGVKDPKYKSKAEMMSKWDRYMRHSYGALEYKFPEELWATYFNNRMANGMKIIITDSEARNRVVFVCAVFFACTPTVFVLKEAINNIKQL